MWENTGQIQSMVTNTDMPINENNNKQRLRNCGTLFEILVTYDVENAIVLKTLLNKPNKYRVASTIYFKTLRQYICFLMFIAKKNQTEQIYVKKHKENLECCKMLQQDLSTSVLYIKILNQLWRLRLVVQKWE